MRTPRQEVLKQLDVLLDEFEVNRTGSKCDDLSDLKDHVWVRFNTRARAAIHRIAGKPSVYVDQCEEIVRANSWPGDAASALAGVLASLKEDAASGYVETQRELIHGELFADFLEMARHLLDEGYKDAAAVIVGGTLEAHLRQLCHKAKIATEAETGKGIVPKKADRLNAELAASDCYSKLDQKSVTAWLDLRNKAAHGRYDEYVGAQVSLLIDNVRDFLTRNPA